MRFAAASVSTKVIGVGASDCSIHGVTDGVFGTLIKSSNSLLDGVFLVAGTIVSKSIGGDTVELNPGPAGALLILAEATASSLCKARPSVSTTPAHANEYRRCKQGEVTILAAA